MAAQRSADAPYRTGQCALWADVGILPLSATLTALHQGACSGRLDFHYAQHEKRVWLCSGEVVFATSSAPVDRLGECLLRAGRLDLAQLEAAERVHRPPARFGRALVECGFLTPHQLWDGVRHQVEEIVRSLFCYAGGVASFRVDTAEPDNVVRLALDTGRLIEEGRERSREIRRFLDLLRHRRARIEPGPRFRGVLAAEERRLVEHLGAGARFEEIVARLGNPPEAVARSIQLLRLVGAVRLTQIPGIAAGEGEERVGALSSDLASGCRRIRLLLDALSGLDGAEPSLDPLLAELGARHSAIAAADPLEAKDLEGWVGQVTSLPGGREQAGLALEQLAAYLAFEIRNHPDILDPDGLLSRLQGPQGQGSQDPD